MNSGLESLISVEDLKFERKRKWNELYQEKLGQMIKSGHYQPAKMKHIIEDISEELKKEWYDSECPYTFREEISNSEFTLIVSYMNSQGYYVRDCRGVCGSVGDIKIRYV